MPTQSTLRFVFIVAPLLFAYVCVNRHSMSINYLTGQLSPISALLAIGCLQPLSSLTARASSASLQLHRRYTPLFVGVALLGHRPVEARLREVNADNFKNTSYYGSPVSLVDKGKNIFITLNNGTKHANLNWSFRNKKWQIRLDKCNNTRDAEIEIADSCKWKFEWYPKKQLNLIVDDGKEHPWKFTDLSLPVNKLLIEIVKDAPTMHVSAETVTGIFRRIKADRLDLGKSPYCMLATGNFSVDVTLKEAECPINVTIMDAELLYDFYEPPTVTPTPTTENGTAAVNSTTQPSPSLDEEGNKFPVWAMIAAGVGGGLLVLVAIVGLIGLIAFCCVRRRRRRPHGHQAQFADDADIDAQVTQNEGLIEWDDVMAHAPYKPKLDEQPAVEDWPFKKGDKVELSTITKCPNSPLECKELEFIEDVKGSEDYGVVQGTFDSEYAAEIYYSRPPDRVKTFGDRLGRLADLHRIYGIRPTSASVPLRTYFWISSDPQKVSYLVVTGHRESVAHVVKEGAEFHERVGFAYTTFAALARLHRLGCVHRDVTPAAFVLRFRRGDNAFCYISHLCLSRFQYDVVGKTWMPRRRRVNYFGTHKYASRAAHAMQERSFKDDVESWFFTAIDLIWPTTAKELVLPWHLLNSEETDRAELHMKYNAEKDKFLRTFDQNKFIVTFPASQFRIIAKEILKMTYETKECDYGSRFVELLDGTIDQLPTQVGGAGQKAVLDYIQSLNANGCRCCFQV